MERRSRSEYLSSFNADVLDRLDRLMEIADEGDAAWFVTDLLARVHAARVLAPKASP